MGVIVGSGYWVVFGYLVVFGCEGVFRKPSEKGFDGGLVGGVLVALCEEEGSLEGGKADLEEGSSVIGLEPEAGGRGAGEEGVEVGSGVEEVKLVESDEEVEGAFDLVERFGG
jgi:hypothetical protein